MLFYSKDNNSTYHLNFSLLLSKSWPKWKVCSDFKWYLLLSFPESNLAPWVIEIAYSRVKCMSSFACAQYKLSTDSRVSHLMRLPPKDLLTCLNYIQGYLLLDELLPLQLKSLVYPRIYELTLRNQKCDFSQIIHLEALLLCLM